MGDRSATVLVADDDSSVTASISLLLKQAGHRPITTSSPAETLDFLKLEEVDLVVQDMNFSRATTGEEGLALLTAIRELKPELPVLLLTAWGSISLAVDGMKAGAADFLTKPWDNDRLLSVIETALDLKASKPQPAADRETLDQEFDFGSIIGMAPPMWSASTCDMTNSSTLSRASRSALISL